MYFVYKWTTRKAYSDSEDLVGLQHRCRSSKTWNHTTGLLSEKLTEAEEVQIA